MRLLDILFRGRIAVTNREAELLITTGRVSVNGNVVTDIASGVSKGDKVSVTKNKQTTELVA